MQHVLLQGLPAQAATPWQMSAPQHNPDGVTSCSALELSGAFRSKLASTQQCRLAHVQRRCCMLTTVHLTLGG